MRRLIIALVASALLSGGCVTSLTETEVKDELARAAAATPGSCWSSSSPMLALAASIVSRPP